MCKQAYDSKRTHSSDNFERNIFIHQVSQNIKIHLVWKNKKKAFGLKRQLRICTSGNKLNTCQTLLNTDVQTLLLFDELLCKWKKLMDMHDVHTAPVWLETCLQHWF